MMHLNQVEARHMLISVSYCCLVYCSLHPYSSSPFVYSMFADDLLDQRDIFAYYTAMLIVFHYETLVIFVDN